MAAKDSTWVELCAEVEVLTNPTAADVRAFVQKYFTPHKIHAKRGKSDGLITGYYEPILNGSLSKTDKYAYPVYAPPELSLIHI